MAFIPSPSSTGGASKVRKGFGGVVNKRASYLMIGYQSSGYQVVYYDQDFNALMPVYSTYNASNFNSHVFTPYFRQGNSTYQTMSSMGFGGMQGTNSYPSSSGGIYASSSMFNSNNGCSWGDFYSDGSYGSSYGSNGYTTKQISAKYYFTSDHKNRSIKYGMFSGRMFARHVNWPDFYAPAYSGLKDYYPTGGMAIHGSMQGTAAYNNTLKEMHICYGNSSNVYQIRKFTNWDFDEYPCPHTAAANATHAFDYTITNPGWNVNNNESKFNSKMLLRDDGQLHMYTFFTSSRFENFYWTNPTSAGNINTTQGGNASNTTSYGIDNGQQYGQHIVSSRDGRNYVFCSVYYYYSAGANFMYSGMGETLNGPSHTKQHHDSNYGYIILPWRDDGFATYYAGNGYASNYSGVYLFNFTGVGGTTGKLEQYANASKYLPYFHGANTTSYPGIAAVNDYPTFKYDPGGKGDNTVYNDKITT